MMPKSPLLKPAIAGRCACVRSCSLEPAGPSSCNDDPKLFIGLIAHQIRAVSASMQAPAPAHVPTPAHTDHVLTHLTAPAAAPSVPAPAAAAHPAPAAHKRRLLPPSLTPHPNPPPAPNVKTPHGPDKRLCHRPSNENCPDTHAHTAPQGLSGARAVAGTVGVGGGREEARAQARPRSGLRAAGCSAVQEGGDRLVALQRSGLPELRFYGEVMYAGTEVDIAWQVAQLMNTDPELVSLDLEWWTTFTLGVPPRKTALIQIAFETRADRSSAGACSLGTGACSLGTGACSSGTGACSHSALSYGGSASRAVGPQSERSGGQGGSGGAAGSSAVTLPAAGAGAGPAARQGHGAAAGAAPCAADQAGGAGSIVSTQHGPCQLPEGTAKPMGALRALGARSRCLLLHVAGLSRLPLCLRMLLEADRPKKVGVNLAGDAAKLKTDFGWELGGRLDLAELAQTRCFAHRELVTTDINTPGSLSGLVETTLLHHLPKPQGLRCSQWERRPLSNEQIMYATLDAFAGLAVYHALQACPLRKIAACE